MEAHPRLPSQWLYSSLISLSLLLSGALHAETGLDTEIERQTKSIGSLQSEALAEPGLALQLLEPQRAAPLQRSGNRIQPRLIPEKIALRHLNGQYFSVFDAHTYLRIDDDHDGFYHNFTVTFDADVSFGSAPVYAELFLSYEGGPWNHYYTSEVFYLYGNSLLDNYEVVTELVGGYPTGHYDILVDLYDAEWDEWLVSYGPYEDPSLRAIPLEGSNEDQGYYNPTLSHSYGRGDFPLFLGILLLGLQGVRRYLGRRQSNR